MFYHLLLNFHIPVGLVHIFRVPSSVQQQQLLPCEDDNNNNNNNNNKINAYNNNKTLGTQSKSAACQDSLGGVGPLVFVYSYNTMYELSGGRYCCCLHIKPFFLPNDISSTLLIVSFLIFHPKEIPGTNSVVTDSATKKTKRR